MLCHRSDYELKPTSSQSSPQIGKNQNEINALKKMLVVESNDVYPGQYRYFYRNGVYYIYVRKDDASADFLIRVAANLYENGFLSMKSDRYIFSLVGLAGLTGTLLFKGATIAFGAPIVASYIGLTLWWRWSGERDDLLSAYVKTIESSNKEELGKIKEIFTSSIQPSYGIWETIKYGLNAALSNSTVESLISGFYGRKVAPKSDEKKDSKKKDSKKEDSKKTDPKEGKSKEKDPKKKDSKEKDSKKKEEKKDPKKKDSEKKDKNSGKGTPDPKNKKNGKENKKGSKLPVATVKPLKKPK